MHYWNYGPGYMLNPGFSILGFIFQVFFWGLVIMLIIKLVRSSHRCHHYEGTEEAGGDRSLGIIRERYAKGEIDKKEFEQLKKDLG